MALGRMALRQPALRRAATADYGVMEALPPTKPCEGALPLASGMPDPDAAGDSSDPDAAGDSSADAATVGLGEKVGDGLGEGLTDGSALKDGEGVGRRPTGSGPTKTNAARMPAATRTPASRPARIVAADLIRRQGTSTDRARASRRGHC
jgi:hypothetical protein